jgi:hypothetical protein
MKGISAKHGHPVTGIQAGICDWRKREPRSAEFSKSLRGFHQDNQRKIAWT